MITYKPGDVVWMLSETRKVNVCHKLQPTYVGPYVITKRLNDQDYVLLKEPKGHPCVLHYNKLKPYKGDYSPLWAKKYKV